MTQLARKLGAFDATMIVMGGIIGAGIFASPSTVASRLGSPTLALVAWATGGAIALVGAFVYAELAERRPGLGGQYAYLRDAYHPIVAFLYGWTLLLVIQTGGMAGSAMVLGSYARDLFGIAAPESAIAITTLLVLTAINCIGVRAGGTVQNTFMVLKLVAIAMVIGAGVWLGGSAHPNTVTPVAPSGRAFLPALVPIIFAYGGWQTASFVSAEMKDGKRDLARGMVIGVVGVVVVYLLVNIVCIRVLGIGGLAATKTPAADIMRAAFGETGGRIIAFGIALSTLGFLSQSMLTAPRVYYAMAADGLFFKSVASVSARTKAPVVAIALQGAWAAAIALIGGYDRLVNYVVSIDALFFGLTGAALIIFRRRDAASETPKLHVPGQPYTTAIYVLAFWALAISTIASFPRDTAMGIVILLLGVPAYLFWKRRSRTSSATVP